MKARQSNFKLKKNDQVKVVTGREKGKTGKILQLNRIKGRAVVQGVNMVKKTVKARKEGEKGGIIEVEAGIHISNLMILCSKCGPTRVGFKLHEGGKSRICHKCGEAL